MKYICLVPDGMSDLPTPELDGLTPWQAARTPNLDKLALDSLVGTVLTVPQGMYPGSDVANMSILGYDPKKYYTGRGPIEAAAMGIPLDPKDVAYRCSLVATDGETLLDYSSGHISTEEATELIEVIEQKLGSRKFKFYPGVQYRHIMSWKDGSVDVKTVPPHDIQDQAIDAHLPQGDGEDELRRLIYDSLELLDNHPVNRRRRDQGKQPGNMIWLWGQGYTPNIPDFFRLRQKQGAVITAVDVVRGLGRAAGLKVIEVPGATGYIDTNYRGKAEYAVRALKDGIDFVYIHIEAPDESGHEGSIEHKIGSIEDIDKYVVPTLLDGMQKLDHLRLVILPDHATPVSLKTHLEGPVPFLLFDSRKSNRASNVPFNETALEDAKTRIDEGPDLISLLFEE
jgi:2,3-bisphosphoglycerate-independent phosphoglycerate mutase